MPRLEWVDSDGQTRRLLSLAPRLNELTPTRRAVGPSVFPLGGGPPRSYRFRKDYGMRFSMGNIAHDQLDTLMALIDHLEGDGSAAAGSVDVYPGGVYGPLAFYSCYLAEGAAIEWTLDRVQMEYSATFDLVTTDGSGPILSPYQGPLWSLLPGLYTKTPAAVRATTAFQWNEAVQLYQSAANTVVRATHYANGRRGVLGEAAGTNLCLRSAHVDPNESEWNDGGIAVGAVADVTSVFAGESAVRMTNPDTTNSRSVIQPLGTLSAGNEAFSVVVENIDALTTTIGIRDATAAGWVHQAGFTWATGALATTSTGVGSSPILYGAELLASQGPNGGAVYRILIGGTPDNSGNNRSLYIYPTGTTQNALSAIVHHAQLEAAEFPTSPIVTTTSSVTRNQDKISAVWPHAPQEITAYVKFQWFGYPDGAASPAIFELGTTANPRLVLVYDVSSARLSANFRVPLADVGSENLSAVVNGSALSYGDEVEVCLTLADDGSLGLYAFINGGTELSDTTASTLTSPGLPPAWSAPVIGLTNAGLLASPANVLIERLTFAPGIQPWNVMRALR